MKTVILADTFEGLIQKNIGIKKPAAQISIFSLYQKKSKLP